MILWDMKKKLKQKLYKCENCGWESKTKPKNNQCPKCGDIIYSRFYNKQ